MQNYIMAVDQGTTSSRCILFDRQGNICSMAQMEFTQIFPKPGWVEHDPMEIWSSQIAVAAKAMGKIGVTEKNIAAIGITNQRETTIVWEKATGKLNLFNAKYELDPKPIEEGCQCPACRHYSRAYIRHLLKAKEMLGMRLCVLHNLYFYNHLMEEIRDAIEAGNYKAFKKEKLSGFENNA